MSAVLSALFTLITALTAAPSWATPAPTTTTLTIASSGSAVTSVVSGTVVTLTATVVSGSKPANPGQVKFCVATAAHCEDSALLATVQLTSAGVATYKFRPGIGSHSYQAVFVATSSYAKSASTAVDLTVTGLFPTTTAIASIGSIGDYTLTSTVVGSGSFLPPGGNVSFLDTTNGNASLGSATLENAALSFTGSTTPVPGDNPLFVAVGDLNGDGIPDLAVMNPSDSSVSVLLGNGDGTFTLKSSPSVGSSPSSIAVADFNGDGILDLAVANSDDNTVTILLGHGDGTFTTKSTPAVGSGPSSIAAGDFNGDGIPDLAVTNSGDVTVTVLLGKGDGTFTLKSSLSVDNSPQSLVVGDFNGDGIPDLAVITDYSVSSTAFDNSVTILLGNGDGTFSIKSTTDLTGYARFIVMGDFNGDGIPDLAVNSDGGTVLLGNGDGTFSVKSTFSPAAPAIAESIAVADFNGDGIADLAVANLATCTTNVFLGNGDGTFGAPISTSSGCNSWSVASGDFNGDGIPDLAVGLSGNTSVTVLLNHPSVGTATLSKVSVSGAEIHQVVASYPGDMSFESSISSAVTLLAAKGAMTALTLSSSSNPSYNGIQFTLTATLSPYFSGSLTTNGETVTFYNEGTSLGTGTLSAGVATLNTTLSPVGTDTLTAVYAGDSTFAAATSNSLTQVVSPNPGYVVTVTTDDSTGVAANCTSAGSSDCSLRDALAASAATGGNITFSPTVFATPQTISLGSGLIIPSNTTITGRTTGSGATLTNLVTVSGGGPVFTVNSGVANAAISNLTITGGVLGENNGGGIFNSGVLTVTNSAISGNGGPAAEFGQGGGIENQGTLTLINSAVTGNNVSLYTSGCNQGCGVSGGGIDNGGNLTLINTTVSGNSASLYISYNGSVSGTIFATGGGINNYGSLTMTNSTVAGNSVNGQGIVNNLGLSVSLQGGGIVGNAGGANNIISGNTNNGSEDDCDGGSCGTNGVGGNIIGPNAQLAPLGNYGGPTQTAPPLPGSSAICAGVIADIPSGTTTDQRGFPRTTAYGSNPPCVDSGAVQTHYALSFSTEPPATTPATTDFTAAVQVRESGNAVLVSGINIMTALAAGDTGSLNVGSINTNSAGIASNSQFQISAPGNDTLVATLPLTAAGVKPAATVSTTSTAVSVSSSSGIEVMVGVSPAGAAFMVDGVSYTATTTLSWPAGSRHTLSAVSPQGNAGTQYTFASWSDGGALTHTVTASPSTIDYTVTFNTSYLLTTSANPSQGGTVSPASGYFPANSPVTLIATANPGYTFTSWTGNVTSNLPSIAITMTGPENATANFTTIPVYTVNTNLDDSAGIAANCTASGPTCSLRDALAAAAAQTSADIVFNSTVFAASQPASARTIVLASAAGTLNVSGNTRILGPTTSSSTTLTQLVTIEGENLGSTGSIFSTNGNVVLSGLAMVNDPAGAITNPGVLTVINCAISGNTASVGGGINNSDVLTVMGSTISGNGVSGGTGGGINSSDGGVTVIDSLITGNSGGGILSGGFFPGMYAGTVTIINSTITGNSGTGIVAQAGVEQSVPPQSLTIANSTISGNTGGAVSVQQGEDVNTNNYIPVALTVTDSILSDCSASGTTCPISGQSGNLVGSNSLLAPLANYGGLTQTQPPLPGSPAICAGVIAEIPSGTTTDQRSFPRTTTYGSNPPCVDSGAVQTHYALSFSAEPPTIVAPNANFSAAVQLSESGNPFPVSGVTIPLTLGAGNTGTLSGGSAATGAAGVATYSSLQVNAAGYGDTLVGMLPLTAQGITPVATASAASSVFDVIQPGTAVAEPVISPPSGTYTSMQSVTITDETPGVTIYYTTNGTTPGRSSAVFSSTPIVVSSSQTIKALAMAPNYLTSPEGVAIYNIVPPYAATPTFTLAGGFYTSSQTVSIMDTTAGATIYYTTNGSTPTTSSPVYAPGSTIPISSDLQLKAIAAAPGFSTSAVAIGNFYVAAAEPLISLPSGTYTSPQSVTITDTTPGAIIYYTTNGTTPSRSSPVFNPATPIAVSSSQTIKALAMAPGYTTSPEGVASYIIAATAPAFNPPGGFYLSTQHITITDATVGATIYYTTNGSTPTTSSPVYASGSTITISSNLRLKAIAVAPALSASSVAIGDFYVAAAEPLISPPTGRYSGTQSVTITDSTPDAIIYYTTDGTTPSRSSPVFKPATPITVSSSQIIKALAMAPGYTTSPEGVASYTIGP